MASEIEKIWLKHYPENVPAEIDIHEYASLLELIDKSARSFHDKPAFECMGKVLNYADIYRSSTAFAAYLQQELGMQKGDRIAVMLPNILQYPIAIYGALLAGLIIVNVNPLYTARELKHQLIDSNAKAIVVLENFARVLAQVIAETEIKHVVVTQVGDLLGLPKSVVVNFVIKRVKKMVPSYTLPATIPFLRALAVGHKCRLIKPNMGHEDLAFLQYTGGTTGIAKGAMLTHGNILANIEQAYAWFIPVLVEGEEIIITSLPLYHIFSLTANCLLFMRLGGLNYLITNPRDLKNFVKELRRVKFTCFTGVNTLFNGLLNTPGFADLDFSPLKMSLGGGMAVQPQVAKKWKDVTGNTLIEAYGLTETSPAVSINPLDIEEFNGSIGLPISSTSCSIQDDEGNLLPIQETGELCVRGPQVMKGYWNRLDDTKKVLSADGWFRTGDIATMNEQGYISIVDRKKDMIIVSGFNVYPNEVESVIASHPGVLEVGVIGVEDKKSGEAVKAVVVKKDAQLTEQTLRHYCRSELTAYKVPTIIEFWRELPKTNVGKILRRELRE